jgi:hypothetical protein
VPRSKEDVIPKWLAEKLAHYARQHHPEREPRYSDYSYDKLAGFGAGSPAGERKLGAAIPTAFHLPEVCESCNRGWMSALEEAAKRLIPGLLEGQPKLLAPFDQFVLAMWTIKTALTYDAAHEDRWIPADHGTRKLFQLGYPLPGSHVMVGHDPDHVMEGAVAHGRQDMGFEVSTNMHAARFAFQFDRLLLKAHVNYGEHPAESRTQVPGFPPSLPYFHQTWPPVPRYWWPSDAALRSAIS